MFLMAFLECRFDFARRRCLARFCAALGVDEHEFKDSQFLYIPFLFFFWHSVPSLIQCILLRTGVNEEVWWFPFFVFVKDLEPFSLSDMLLCKTHL